MTLIRPLIYVPEKLTKRFVKQNNLEIMPKVCPEDGETSRQYAFNLLKQLQINNKQSRANILAQVS